VKLVLAALLVAVALPACSSSYPYLVTTNDCNCERFIYRGERGRFDVEVSARYVVSDRINSEIELVFRNHDRDSLSLRQAYIKGTSTNVRYQNNDRFQPMPYVIVPPRGAYTMTLRGSDVQVSENPWLKIAGEKIVIELRGLLLGKELIAPIVLTLVPYNPKLDL
jgi:hypothetical protein